MDIALLALLVVIAFVALLGVGRSQIAKASNPQVANGAVLLVLATIVGLLVLGLVASLDVW